MKKQLLVLSIFILFTATLNAQVDLPRLSPKASVSQTIGYTVVTIDYCRPAVKDRKIWGGLVPYDKIWRTGANEATTIQFTTDVTVEGNKVPAGRYALFTIPNENEWIIILNKNDAQWGAFNYKQEEDLLRFKVKPAKGNFTERLLFSFSAVTDVSADVFINWENIQISFRVEVDLINQVHAKIKEALAANPGNAKVFYTSAEYAADHEFLLNEALQWVDKAISIDPNFYAYYVKAKVLFKQKKFVEALRAMDKCRETGRNDKDYESNAALIDLLEKQIKEKLK